MLSSPGITVKSYRRRANMKLHDPVTGEQLDLYMSRGESSEVWRADEASVIKQIASHYMCEEQDAKRRLENSDIDSPVIVNDEVYWVE
jgi:hypothetical protein